jgi:hypothetical protein
MLISAKVKMALRTDRIRVQATESNMRGAGTTAGERLP